MSKLKELIEKLCPDGVIFKTLGELHSDKRSIMRGIRITKKDLIENGHYKVYGGGEDIIFGYYNKYNIKKDTVTINVAGSVGFVDYITEDSWIVDSRYAFFTNQMNLKFLYYALKNKENELRSFVKGAIPGINMDLLMKVSVPIPPMEVQREIVRILDNFTELTAELTAELEARTKQYEYYKNVLCSFEKIVSRKKIKDIATISRGIRVVKNDLSENFTYPVFQNKLAPMGFYHTFNTKKDTTYLISAGAAGQIGFSEVDFWAADDCLVFTELLDVNSKYLYYYLLTQQSYILSMVRKASIPRLSRTVIENLEIPIPPLEEQERIVSILDKFSSLVNDIKEGLPAEIELRRKQYEYYRNKLLTFE